MSESCNKRNSGCTIFQINCISLFFIYSSTKHKNTLIVYDTNWSFQLFLEFTFIKNFNAYRNINYRSEKRFHIPLNPVTHFLYLAFYNGITA